VPHLHWKIFSVLHTDDLVSWVVGHDFIFRDTIFHIKQCHSNLLALRLPKPDFATSMNTMHASTAAVPPSVGSGSFKFKMICGGIIGLVVLGIVASRNVGFMEKHAPSVNAQLHQGEITEESDGEYTGTKIFADLDALNKDTKGTTWAEIRTEVISRETYLADLKTQNDKLQRRMAIERNENLGANDHCEQMALYELAPALDDYVKAIAAEFIVVQKTLAPTQEAASAMKDLGGQEERARQQINVYVARSNAKGCK
jgi:hypothetical protein